VKALVAAGVVALAAAVTAGGSVSATATGGRIAFTLEQDGFTSLYSARPDGSGLRHLTAPRVLSGTGGDSEPAWSPDGRRLVFARDLPYFGVDHVELYVVPARGGGARRLTRNTLYDLMPTYSPDGRRIAFVRAYGSVDSSTSSLATMRSDGRGTVQPITNGPLDVTPSWSPDGKTIAFSRLPTPDSPLAAARLYLASSDGSDVRPLGSPAVAGWQPEWSPDGKRLAFVSFRDGNGATCSLRECFPHGELYVVGADGSGLTRLTTSRADDEHPTWSPDGRRLAFTSGFDEPRDGHLPWLYVMSASGGSARAVVRGNVGDPSWSPAGVR
jgi:TolB protein